MAGNVHKRPSGKWRARYRDDLKKEHARHFDTKIEAQRWLDEETASKVSGSWVDPKAGKITFNSFYADWSQRQQWESNTGETMALAMRRFPYADLPIKDVRFSHIEAWTKSMTTAGLKPATVGTRFRCVARVFAAAVRDRRISENPTVGVRLPASPRKEDAMKIPSPEQLRALLEAADEEFRVFMCLCSFGGLRPAEAASVKVGDISFLSRPPSLRVQRQVQRGAVGQGVEERQPKRGSVRTVYLPDDLVMMLSEQIARRGIVGQSDAWLFVGRDGTMPPRQNTISIRWQRVCRRAGVYGFTPHSLRHWFASGLIESGECSVIEVQRAMGHSKPSTTLDVYSHKWRGAEDRTRTAVAGLMAAVQDQHQTEIRDLAD